MNKIRFKKLLILLFIIPISINLFSQNNLEMGNKFKNCKNDSLFLVENGINSYKKFSIRESNPLSKIDSILFSLETNSVYGPVKTNNQNIWYKVINKESCLERNVGNIWLSSKRSEIEIEKITNEVLKNADKEIAYDTYCKLYSDDKNKTKDCGIGWFKPGKMVKKFDEGLEGHLKNDIFQVNTQFGVHIVKMIEDPREIICRVDYIKLITSKIDYEIKYQEKFIKATSKNETTQIGNINIDSYSYEKDNILFTLVKYDLPKNQFKTKDEISEFYYGTIYGFAFDMGLEDVDIKEFNNSGFMGKHFSLKHESIDDNIIGRVFLINDTVFFLTSIDKNIDRKDKQLEFLDSFKILEK